MASNCSYCLMKQYISSKEIFNSVSKYNKIFFLITSIVSSKCSLLDMNLTGILLSLISSSSSVEKRSEQTSFLGSFKNSLSNCLYFPSSCGLPIKTQMVLILLAQFWVTLKQNLIILLILCTANQRNHLWTLMTYQQI